MKEPPYMISPKDLLYLEDLLSHTLVFIKKCKHYTTLANNSDVKEHLEKVSDLLTNQYDELIEILEG